MNETIAEIKAEFADAEGWPRTTALPRARVLTWMRHEDLEVLGALHRLLRYKGGLARVQPPFDFGDYYDFLARYYRRCLCEFDQDTLDPGWEEADWGIAATHAVVFWFLDLWRDKSVPRSVLKQTKEWLAQLLLECPRVSELLATAIYDHLLTKRAIRKFFADWEADPQLRRFVG